MSVGGGRGGYFQIVPETGEIVSYLVPPDNPDPTKHGEFRPASVKKLFTGMTTDGERVWVVDELEGNPLIYELDVSFQTTGPCARAASLGELCVPGGEPFCGDGAMCHGEPGAETCQVPAALGELCVPGGEPFCGEDAVCYGKPAAETCQVACDVAAPSCPDDLTCQSIAGVGDVCLPAPPASSGSDETEDAGCSCSVVGSTWGGRAGGSLLLAGGVFLWLRRRRYGLPAR